MLDSLHQKSDLELYGDWRHTFRVIFIGVPLNWNHVLRHFKAQSLFFKGMKDRNYPCLFHSTMLITHKNTHESHLAHAWNLLYGKQSFFFPFCAPSVLVSNTSWNHFDSKSSCSFLFSLSSDYYLSVPLHLSILGYLLSQCCRFFRPISLVILQVIPGSKEEAPGSSPITPSRLTP